MTFSTLISCRFTFDGVRAFDGFTDCTTWNGFDNVSVTPAVRDSIVAFFNDPECQDGNADLLAMSPDEHGLISLAYGYATQIVRDMSFKEFQATRTECADLGEFLRDEGLMNCPGLIYCGALYIECASNLWPEEARERGTYDLILGRDEWISPDLETLERKLYAYAISEGYTA